MQAPAKSTHRRSLNVPARIPERKPVPVLGLELAARQHPPSLLVASPGPPASTPPRPRAGPQSTAGSPAAAGRGRRGLMLAVCCMGLFMVGLGNTIVTVGPPGVGP